MKKPTKAAIKRAIKNLLAQGQSSHSAQGMLVGPYIQHLERIGQPYRLEAHPGYGYHLRLIRPVELGDDYERRALKSRRVVFDFEGEQP